jgi:hypothetical protein
MSDNLPGLSGDMGAGRPLTPAEFKRRERERRAFDMYVNEGKTFPQIKKALNLRSNEAAREQVMAGNARWIGEERDALIAKMFAGQTIGLGKLQDMLMKMSLEDQNLSALDRLLKVMERGSRLHALDAEKEDNGKGDTYVVVEGNIINAPEGSVVVDVRKPWERPENQQVIEGELVNDEGLPEEP